MQKLSNSKLLSIFTTLLTLLLIAKLISLVLWWFLPSEGVELNAANSYQAKYQRVDFKNMLIPAKVVEQAKSKESVTSSISTTSINSLILKGLYGKGDNGFAIVAKKSAAKKTTIVAVGEGYEGYKLKEILIDRVLFSKLGKEYVLMLNEEAAKNTKSSIKRVEEPDDSTRPVSKQDINYYSKHPDQIWKDIAISPVQKSGKIDGFIVNRIKAGSKMAELGLMKGDVIIKANNIVLKSYKDALELYKKIDKIDVIELVVRRNNQEKELVYEIN
ncbi:type II secretion system protein N [Sulfurimonas aquatica]|nr:type II secretion system protein N [Sulfurimonas aquatica]